MLGIIACIVEVLIEVFGLFVFIGVPFVVIGLICEVVKRHYKAKYYKSNTKRAKLHRRIYDFLVNIGYESDVAYKMATSITHWE